MRLILKMLIIANMDLITENALDFGITIRIGTLEIYVIEIVEKSGILNILKLRNDCHQKLKQNGGDNYVIHKQEDLYKIPAELICEILVSLTD